MNAILREDRLTPDAAAALLGVPRKRVYRWLGVGVRGKRLEAVRLGGRLVTSREAVARFLERLGPTPDVELAGVADTKRQQRDNARARRELHRRLG